MIIDDGHMPPPARGAMHYADARRLRRRDAALFAAGNTPCQRLLATAGRRVKLRLIFRLHIGMLREESRDAEKAARFAPRQHVASCIIHKNDSARRRKMDIQAMRAAARLAATSSLLFRCYSS